MIVLESSILDTYLDLSIATICPNGYDDPAHNHCAHFVAHALGLDFGQTCASLTRNAPGPGANLRVHEIFERCPGVEELNACPTNANHLVFVSAESNFSGDPQRLRNVPRKHIGIGVGGLVWHYSNTRDTVVKQSIDMFLSFYRNQANAIWLGELPAVARLRPAASCPA